MAITEKCKPYKINDNCLEAPLIRADLFHELLSPNKDDVMMYLRKTLNSRDEEMKPKLMKYLVINKILSASGAVHSSQSIAYISIVILSWKLIL